ncbi:MAG: 3-hydroxyacyl-CoA dehydrogenase family protein [Planctomycetes bacterium]|nr:3-hydroxyacyl-CoA dehydrogenase family protein [Planctomycetota bacterium]
MQKQIKTVAVIGASGTIGSLTGGILAQNGIQVYFLSRTKEGLQKGLNRAIKQARSEVIAKYITCGDYDTLFDKACSQADWILECVAEDMAVKKEFYAKVDAVRRPDSIVSSVTSSLPLEELPVGRSPSFCANFLSTHFYNPPGKMMACELTGQNKTDPGVVAFMHQFLEKKLRRAVIPVTSAAAFAGNRLAFLLFARITELVKEHGVEMMDYLIGPYTGRLLPPLATIDLVGLDIHKAIILSLQKYTQDAMHNKLTIPGYVEKMIADGYLGNKTRGRGGFYKKLESGQFTYMDPASGDYIPAFGPHIQFVERAKNQIHIGLYKDAFQTILAAKGTEADIVREIMATYLAYAYMLIGQATEEKDGIGGIDKVMATGFHWACPSLVVHMLGGNDQAAQVIQSAGLAVPQSLAADTTWQKYYFNAGKYFIAG